MRWHIGLGLWIVWLGLPFAAAGAAEAALTLAQVRQLPPLPAEFRNSNDRAARTAWLSQRLQAPASPVERYRLQRTLALEHLFAHQAADALEPCRAAPPLPDDLAYRAACLEAATPEAEDLLARLVGLADEARQRGDRAGAATLLSDVAWRLSQAGDVAGAMQHFEAALRIVPPDDVELMSGLLQDTATSYIVNGDEATIQRGIQLLADSRERMVRELANPHRRIDAQILRDNIALADFNRGIAHLLHRADAAQALPFFERVVDDSVLYRHDALVFAALAAAEQGQIDRAKAHVARLDGAAKAAAALGSTPSPAVSQYLRCYRELTVRHWSPTQPVSACLALRPDTTTEVQLDVYKRLSVSSDPAIALAGLQRLKGLFLDKLEPQLRRRASSAASHAELQRLQRESDLKTQVLQQQEALQRERDATHAQRQQTLVAVALLMLSVALLVATRWRAKKKLAEQFERLSLTDPLTGLGNRRYLEQHMARELAHWHRLRRRHPEATLGFFLFDVDRFKSINDRFGHAVGDEVLVTLAQRVQAATRPTDLLVRWGGEEFLLLTVLDEPSRCQQVAQRLLSAVHDTPFPISGHDPLPVTCTIGAVRGPFAGEDLARAWPSLVALADQALYHGKAEGRDRWVLLHNQSVGDAEALERLLATPLVDALASGRLTVEMGGIRPSGMAA